MTAFELATWDRITPGVVALGMPLGGASYTEAAARMAGPMERFLDRQLRIEAGTHVWTLTPRELGVHLSAADLGSRAFHVGRHGSPPERVVHQVAALLDGQVVAPESSTTQAALDAIVARFAREVERRPQNAHLSLARDGGVQFTSAQIGVALDVPESRQRLIEALTSGDSVVKLALREVVPAVRDDHVATARHQVERLFATDGSPLTLTFGQRSWPLERAEVAELLSIEGGTPSGEEAVLHVDDELLMSIARRLADEVDESPRDARFAFNGGDLEILRESRPGRRLDQPSTVGAIRLALLQADRTTALPVLVVPPSVSSANPRALGIRELIDGGSTSFAGSIPEKAWNIRLAAERLNGVVVPPGGTFSFNKEVGPTTLEAGFRWGLGITSSGEGVRTVPSVAGGICQVATTLFHPVFWSGYQLGERYWHLYWIPAYTSRGVVGLDVTVDSDAGLDFKWTNPTSDYVLIQAAADQDRVYFSLYGKKPTWTDTVSPALISNRAAPDPHPVAEPEPSLPWGSRLLVETAREGFDVQVQRRVSHNSGPARELHLRSSYQPARTVTLVGTAGMPDSASLEDELARVLGTPDRPSSTPANRPIGDSTRAKPVEGSPTPEPEASPRPSPSVKAAPSPGIGRP